MEKQLKQKEFEFDKIDFFCFNKTENKTIIKLFPLSKWNKTFYVRYDVSSIGFFDAQLEFINSATKYRIGNHETKRI